MIRVYLVGDVRLNREAVASLLARDGRLKVTVHAAAADGFPGRSAPVDVVVVDTAADAGREALRCVIENAETPIVALGVPDDDGQVIALAELGVVGFVEREASLDEFVASVLGAAHGEASCPPRIATTLLRRVSALAAGCTSAHVTALTVRERQVVQLIAEGLSNKEIAARLCIEVATVKNHVHNILEKLDVNRRSDAVARLHAVETADEMPTLELARARSRTQSTAG